MSEIKALEYAPPGSTGAIREAYQQGVSDAKREALGIIDDAVTQLQVAPVGPWFRGYMKACRDISNLLAEGSVTYYAIDVSRTGLGDWDWLEVGLTYGQARAVCVRLQIEHPENWYRVRAEAE